MTSKDFRRLALKLPGAVEAEHMGHPDFRVNGKIFATLQYPNDAWGMVKLPPEQQDEFMRLHSEAFVPVKGAWGRQGCTSVKLEAAEPGVVERALRLAWTRAGAEAKKPAKKRAARKTIKPGKGS